MASKFDVWSRAAVNRLHEADKKPRTVHFSSFFPTKFSIITRTWVLFDLLELWSTPRFTIDMVSADSFCLRCEQWIKDMNGWSIMYSFSSPVPRNHISWSFEAVKQPIAIFANRPKCLVLKIRLLRSCKENDKSVTGHQEAHAITERNKHLSIHLRHWLL